MNFLRPWREVQAKLLFLGKVDRKVPNLAGCSKEEEAPKPAAEPPSPQNLRGRRKPQLLLPGRLKPKSQRPSNRWGSKGQAQLKWLARRSRWEEKKSMSVGKISFFGMILPKYFSNLYSDYVILIFFHLAIIKNFATLFPERYPAEIFNRGYGCEKQ